MKIKYSPSINIVRDNDYVLDYIPTKNSSQVFGNILQDAKVGMKSHLIIGAYGTGKSSFLVALKQTLEKSYLHFYTSKNVVNKIREYEFINVVGEYKSLEHYFARLYNLGKRYSTSEIIKALDREYSKIEKKGKGFAIIIDEFGKHLEYAAKNSPESELYFIQQLAEWINDPKKNTLLIATLHQDFSAYSLQLNRLQRQEWDKVKGRFKEIPFNEPVEQLLYLASERISSMFNGNVQLKSIERLFKCIEASKVFPLRDYFELEFAKKLYPFDILSASILTLALQKYGQNERSLFSFIESNDHLGIKEFDFSSKGYYSIPNVYDYLLNNYYTYINSKYNPHYSQWSTIRRSLERIDGLFGDINKQKNAEDLLKLIVLLNLFSSNSAKLTHQFYVDYMRYACNASDIEDIFDQLIKKKIIRYVAYNFRYVLFEGTDLDIEIAIDDAGRFVEKINNVVNHLTQYFEFPFITAKSTFYKRGTPRFFQFKLTEDPVSIIPEGEIDGYINLVFSEENDAEERLIKHSVQCQEAILFGYYKNTSEIKKILFEIQKIIKVKDANSDDKVAIKELNNILEHYIRLLNHFVFDDLYTDRNVVIWYFKGNRVSISNRQLFNQQLSIICESVYSKTPIYKNELVNRTKTSGQVSAARKKLLERLVMNIHDENLGFSASEFPPERSIYLSLIKETGMHHLDNGVGNLISPSEATFKRLWELGEVFLESAKDRERNLKELIDILSVKPFKLKQGLLEFWIPIFLLAKADEYALYENGTFVPSINSDVLDLINKRPGIFNIKTFDVDGVKLELFNRYRIFLNQSENTKPTNKLFIQTIKPFLLFYRDLPEYAKNTNRLNKRTIEFRKVISTAKDPEKSFFVDFPSALGYSILDLQSSAFKTEVYITKLQESVRELRTSYDNLIDRLENYLTKNILTTEKKFPDYKVDIINRFKGLKNHLLLGHQKVFISRLFSTLDDRKAWLNSIAQACLGKPLAKISDDEERILYEKVSAIFYELDNLVDLSHFEIDNESEELLKIEITSPVLGLVSQKLRISRENDNAINDQLVKVRKVLSSDKRNSVVVLAKLLNELLRDEK